MKNILFLDELPEINIKKGDILRYNAKIKLALMRNPKIKTKIGAKPYLESILKTVNAPVEKKIPKKEK